MIVSKEKEDIKMTLKKLYENRKPVGTFTLCNFGGLEILEIIYGIEDKAVACFNYGCGRIDIRKHKIYTTSSGRSYIRKQNKRYYFDEIMRI